MGKPRKEDVRDFQERLAWFSLERYNELSHLDSLGWYKQIQVRRSLYQRLTVDFPHFIESEHMQSWIHSDAEFFLSIIKHNPIVDFEENPEFEFEIPDLRTPVHSTTIEEFYLAEISANRLNTAKARRFFDKARNYRYEAWRDGARLDFYGHAARVASVIDGELTLAKDTTECNALGDGFGKEYFFDEDISIGRWAESPLQSYLGLSDVAILSIDLRAPASVLEEHFRAHIDRLKTDPHRIRAPKLNPADWIRYGLLPYIDLELWRLTTALPNYGEAVEQIPDLLIKDLILREDQSENSKHPSIDHTISKVTRVYFETVCVQHSSMYALLENEAAAQFHQTGTQPRLQRYALMKRLRERKQREKKQNPKDS